MTVFVARKLCHIASDGDLLAHNRVAQITIPGSFSIALGSLDGEIAICFDCQPDVRSDSFGRGHGDDTFGEKGAGGEERAEEDEEPDA